MNKEIVSKQENQKHAQDFLDVLNGKYPDRKMQLVRIYRRDERTGKLLVETVSDPFNKKSSEK